MLRASAWEFETSLKSRRETLKSYPQAAGWFVQGDLV